jgi:hypothetical protein
MCCQTIVFAEKVKLLCTNKGSRVSFKKKRVNKRKQNKRSSKVRPQSQEHPRCLPSLPLSSLCCLLLTQSRTLASCSSNGGELGDPAARFLLSSVHCHPEKGSRSTAAAMEKKGYE